MTHVFRRLIAVLSVAAVGAATAHAAAIPSGATVAVYAALVRGNAVAFDSVDNVYLVVGSQGAGNLRGRFVDNNGVPLGTPFLIQASGNYTHFPRVAFSPDADGGNGGFLVTWHESDMVGGNTSIHGRIVSFAKNGPAGNDVQLAADGSWWEAGPAVAYASGSKEFLVAWRRLVGNDIRAVRVGLDGTVKAPAFNITNDTDYQDNPSIGYDPNTDQFLVAYAGYGTFGYVDARLVQAGSGAMIGAAATRLFAGVAAFITDTTFISSSNQFLVAWYNGSTSLGRLVSADDTALGNVITLSTRWKANDALSIAYNALTNTTMLVSHYGVCGSVSTGICVEDGGVEINADGTPVDNGFQITSAGGNGNFYPRIAASTKDATWLVSTANNFTSAMAQLVAGTPAGPHVNPPNPMMWVDAPTAGKVSPSFSVSGWAVDLGSSTGSGADLIHVWAWPSSGSPIFLGATTPSESRPDIGNLFGSGFANSGYTLKVNSLPPGSYVLAVYMHSTVTNTFSAVRAVNISVGQPNPNLWIDTPGNGTTVPSSGFNVGGWAVDIGAASGPGMAAVHVWAFPVGGGAPIFAGAAAYGNSRPDIGALFGPQFTNSGYNIMVTLPPGTYDLGVYGYSAVANAFNIVRSVRVVVQ